MKNTFIFNGIVGVLVTIAVLVAFAVHQNKEDEQEMKAAPTLEIGSCYAFSDHISLGKGKFPLFKILMSSSNIEYVETSWLPDKGFHLGAGWQGDESISERHSMFYTKVKCPGEIN